MSFRPKAFAKLGVTNAMMMAAIGKKLVSMVKDRWGRSRGGQTPTAEVPPGGMLTTELEGVGVQETPDEKIGHGSSPNNVFFSGFFPNYVWGLGARITVIN